MPIALAVRDETDTRTYYSIGFSFLFVASVALPLAIFEHHSISSLSKLPSLITTINQMVQIAIKTPAWWCFIPLFAGLAVFLLAVFLLALFSYHDVTNADGKKSLYYFLSVYFRDIFTKEWMIQCFFVTTLNMLVSLVSFGGFDPSGHVRVILSTVAMFAHIFLNVYAILNNTEREKLPISHKNLSTLIGLFFAIGIFYLVPLSITLVITANIFHTLSEVIAGLVLGVAINTIVPAIKQGIFDSGNCFFSSSHNQSLMEANIISDVIKVA